MIRILSVVGARPQFIKAGMLSAEFRRRGIQEILVHTGQHYDTAMSDTFFEELELPEPAYRLGVGSAGHGAQTGEMLKRLEPIVERERPDWVLVYGDTNSTLAGALAGVKLRVPTAHVEAGLRSFNRDMPEEINRLVADRVSDLLLVPNEGAAAQLRSEGVRGDAIELVGDLQIDLVRAVAARIGNLAPAAAGRSLQPGAYGVMTVHRANNTDDEAAFARILEGVRRSRLPIVFPVHPRTRPLAQRLRAGQGDNLIVCDPLPYGEMISLLNSARMLFTDSGGLQKEAFALRVCCTTLREETEWVETLEDGWNVLAGSDPNRIESAALRPVPSTQNNPYGDGNSAGRIAEAIQVRTRSTSESRRRAS